MRSLCQRLQFPVAAGGQHPEVPKAQQKGQLPWPALYPRGRSGNNKMTIPGKSFHRHKLGIPNDEAVPGAILLHIEVDLAKDLSILLSLTGVKRHSPL